MWKCEHLFRWLSVENGQLECQLCFNTFFLVCSAALGWIERKQQENAWFEMAMVDNERERR